MNKKIKYLFALIITLIVGISGVKAEVSNSSIDDNEIEKLIEENSINNVSSTSDIKCTYSNNSYKAITVGGIVTQFNVPQGYVIAAYTNKNSYDASKFANSCPNNIYGFIYKRSSSDPGVVFLYTDNNYLNTDLYKKLESSTKSYGNIEKKIGNLNMTLIENYVPINDSNDEDSQNFSPNISLDGNVSCGNGTLKNIPGRLVKIINTIVTVIQIAVPVLLIILGMVDFAKAAMAQKEDEIKKGQKIFISRLITGIMIFFVIFIVKIGVRFVNDKTESDTVLSCVDCFISGKCQG